MRRRQAFAKAAADARDREATAAMELLGDALTSFVPDNHPVAVVEAVPETRIYWQSTGPLTVWPQPGTTDGASKPLNSKGFCPKCQRYIGRGVTSHARKCRGADE